MAADQLFVQHNSFLKLQPVREEQMTMFKIKVMIVKVTDWEISLLFVHVSALCPTVMFSTLHCINYSNK